MRFAHGTHVGPKVALADPLDGQRDGAGALGDAVARGALLEGLVLDVVTQQLVAGTPPLHGHVALVVMVTRTGQSDARARPTQHLDEAPCWERVTI